MGSIGYAKSTAEAWYELFSKHAEDLYPGRYSIAKCRELAEQNEEIQALAKQKCSMIVAHNYLYPEFHEAAAMVGDSLGLAQAVRKAGAKRVDFESVAFMGETAKMINGDATRVFIGDAPQTLGCSLVFGTDHKVIAKWRQQNPGGVLVTYVNSDAYTKAASEYISTSRNTHRVILQAAKDNPGRKILVLPDKYLGYVMKSKALEEAAKEGFDLDPDLIEVYTAKLGQWNACCYVHEKIGEGAPEQALDEYPDAELLIHPECGCASSCLLKMHQGIIPQARAYFLSTEAMLERARVSPAQTFVVATEKGMVYRLRKMLPEKKFVPVSQQAECQFMKANTFEKLLRSLKEDRIEILLCDDCCDPRQPYQDARVVHIPRSVAAAARVAIDRMLTIT